MLQLERFWDRLSAHVSMRLVAGDRAAVRGYEKATPS